jgi:uncharacterized protein (DUF362 family)
LGRLSNGPLEARIEAALSWLNWEKIIGSGARVAIKPNLTWRQHIPGVTVTPEFLAAFVRVIRSRTPHIAVVESDGGYHGYSAEEAFQGHGLYELAKTTGVQLLNLSRAPRERVSGTIAGRSVSLELPSTLLHEVDTFITVPVPKVHAMTGVSLGFKNQWGCLPDPMRLRLHPEFTRAILLINRALRPRLAVFDGQWFLDRTGPMIGQAVRKDLIIASDDPGAGSLACCRVMGIDPRNIRHLALAQREAMMPVSLEETKCNEACERYFDRPFTLKRSPINLLALAAFRSRTLNWLGYDSAFADLAHKALYRLRRNRAIAAGLYGEQGAPAVEGDRKTRYDHAPAVAD